MKFHCFPNKDGGCYPPNYATEGSAGMDVQALESTTIAPGDRALVDTGIVAIIPEGLEIQVRPRSGLALKHGVTVLNSPGTIDSDYRGRIKVLLINHGKEPFEIKRGDRVAQLVVARVERVKVDWTYAHEGDEEFLASETTRGSGGYGSTGV